MWLAVRSATAVFTRVRVRRVCWSLFQPAIALPRGKGIKRTIFEQRAARLKH